MKVVFFVISVVATFVYAGIALTKLSGTGGDASIAGEISEDAGEAIFFGKGKCYTCHSFGTEGSAVRCPNLGVFGDKFLAPVGVRAAERKAAEGMNAIQYLVESLYNPNAYLVEGYSKDLMKPIHRPPIALSDDEIASVILYLLAASDVDIEDETVTEIHLAQAPFASGEVAIDTGGGEFEFPAGDPEDGRYSFDEMRCHQCHKVEGVAFEEDAGEGGIGPDLTLIGSIQTRSYLMESILDPNKIIVADPPGQQPGDEGSYRDEFGNGKMPDFHDSMTLRQMLDIAAFLETLQGAEKNTTLYSED